jgi:hypothetical protein
VIRDLEARTVAIQTNLKRYAATDSATRKRYRYLIEHADIDSSYGLALCARYKFSTMPLFVNFLSLRSLSMYSFFEVDRDRRALRAFADELEENLKLVSGWAIDNQLSLRPSRRLGEIACTKREGGGGGFGFSYYTCCFPEDGNILKNNCAGSFKEEGPARRKAEERWRIRANEFGQFQRDVQVNLTRHFAISC